MNCLLCTVSVPPGSRAFLKTKEDVLSCLKSLLKNSCNVDLGEFLKKQVVCRKKCLNTLLKILKLRKELVDLERDVTEKLGTAIDQSIASVSSNSSFTAMQAAGPTVSPPVTITPYNLRSTPSRSRSRSIAPASCSAAMHSNATPVSVAREHSIPVTPKRPPIVVHNDSPVVTVSLT